MIIIARRKKRGIPRFFCLINEYGDDEFTYPIPREVSFPMDQIQKLYLQA